MLSKHGESDKLAESTSCPGCTASILALMDMGVGFLLQCWELSPAMPGVFLGRAPLQVSKVLVEW